MEGLRIIMLGKLRSGKNTVGDLICALLKEKDVELVSRRLAIPIYDEAQDFYKRHGLVWRKNRKLLEGIGEALNEDYPGGDKVIELYAEKFNPKENIFVEDCRRLTQANFFANQEIGKTIFVRVTADREVRKARCKDAGEWSEGHVTDIELDDFPATFEISNNGSDLDELKRTVMNLVELIRV